MCTTKYCTLHTYLIYILKCMQYKPTYIITSSHTCTCMYIHTCTCKLYICFHILYMYVHVYIRKFICLAHVCTYVQIIHSCNTYNMYKQIIHTCIHNVYVCTCIYIHTLQLTLLSLFNLNFTSRSNTFRCKCLYHYIVVFTSL